MTVRFRFCFLLFVALQSQIIKQSPSFGCFIRPFEPLQVCSDITRIRVIRSNSRFPQKVSHGTHGALERQVTTSTAPYLTPFFLIRRKISKTVDEERARVHHHVVTAV
jgi:hypothetical protein